MKKLSGFSGNPEKGSPGHSHNPDALFLRNRAVIFPVKIKIS